MSISIFSLYFDALCVLTLIYIFFSDRRDGIVRVALAAIPAADPHRTGETVVHRTRGVRPSLRQGKPSLGNVLQGHEKDAKSRVLRAVVQQTLVFRRHRSLQSKFHFKNPIHSKGELNLGLKV